MAISGIKSRLKQWLLGPIELCSDTPPLTRWGLRVRLKLRRLSLQIQGPDNAIHIGANSSIECAIRIVGSGNRIRIGSDCYFTQTTIDVVSDRSTIDIGDGTAICGNHMGYSHLLAKGTGTEIHIGKSCLISYGIDARTTDSHSIRSTLDERLINPPKNIRIGDHVWVGARTMILKGAIVGDGSIIGAGSIVTKPIASNVLAVGQPAREIRSNIRWELDPPEAGAEVGSQPVASNGPSISRQSGSE